MALDPTYLPNPSALRTTEHISAPTYETIINALFQATSPDIAVLERATAYLSDLEAHPEFWLLLIEVAFERNSRIDGHRLAREEASSSISSGSSLEEAVAKRWTAIRTVAIIRFKNGVDKYWRSRVVNRVTITIPADTKIQLRRGLLQCLDEPDRIVSLQASVAIARIARHDFPNAWPELFSSLQQAMIEAHANMTSASLTGSGSTLDLQRLILLRASDVCQKTLKELSTVRILAGKIRMTELSRLLLPTLVPMFQQYFLETFEEAAIDMKQWIRSPFLPQRIRTSHLLLKSVTYLAVGDMGTLTRNASVGAGLAANLAQDFFRTTPGLLQTLRNARLGYIDFMQSNVEGLESIESDMAGLVVIQKHYLGFGKMYLALLNRDKSKAVTWPGWEEVVWWYWQEAKVATESDLAATSKSAGIVEQNSMQRLPTRFIVQSLILLRQSIEHWKLTETMPAYLKDDSVIREIVDILINKMMLLTRDDLEMWQDDAEDWSLAEEADVYDVDVRPAAERTLMVLAAHTSKMDVTVGEIVWSMYEQLSRQPALGTIDDVLRRDAVYAALGRCRDQLPISKETMSEITARQFVIEGGLHLGSGHSLVILRRRIAWLIWEWSEQMQENDRPAIYEFLVSLLGNVPGKTDAAVRLASTRSLSALADALEFNSDAFQPFVGEALSNLATLAAGSELHEMDSIRTCTNAMSIIIERMGPRIAPHLQSLANLVPNLWMLEDLECKAKPSVIIFVGKLVRSVELLPGGSKQSGDSLHGIIEVIVRDSLQPSNLPLLGKDALELWIRALRSSVQMSESLFRLLPLLSPLLSQPEYCPEACRIAQESTLLAPQQVIAQHGMILLSEFAKIIADPMSALILHPITAIDLIMQALQARGVEASDWARLLDQSGLFYALLGTLLKVKDSVIVAGYYVALLARLCFMANGSSFFYDLLQSTAIRLEGPACFVVDQVTKPMIVQWCKRFENMASTRKRKLTCLGLASLLASAEPNTCKDVYDQLPLMIGVWMDMLGDLLEDANGETPPIPNAPPSSPLDYHRSSSKDLLRRSPSPALSIPGLEGLDDDGDWLEDTSPGKARLLELHRIDKVNTVKLSTYITNALQQAQQRGGQAFLSAVSKVDPLVLDIFQKDLNR